jgi:hypothetical protein
VEHEPTPLVNADERPLVRDAVIGILGGMVAFAVLTAVIVRLAWRDESWGFAVVIGGFAGFWAGLFFGSAAGIAFFQSREGQGEAPAATETPTETTTTTPPSGTPTIRTT